MTIPLLNWVNDELYLFLSSKNIVSSLGSLKTIFDHYLLLPNLSCCLNLRIVQLCLCKNMLFSRIKQLISRWFQYFVFVSVYTHVIFFFLFLDDSSGILRHLCDFSPIPVYKLFNKPAR
jgi:hypothetical protein